MPYVKNPRLISNTFHVDFRGSLTN